MSIAIIVFKSSEKLLRQNEIITRANFSTLKGYSLLYCCLA